MVTADTDTALAASVMSLRIALIRRDGGTQHRAAVDPRIVAEYAELMRDGAVFLPIRVWWDGENYWLSDGFQRVAAAEIAGLAEIAAEVRLGTRSDAQWDSYSANAVHGSRLTCAERQCVVRFALEHPNAAKTSSVQMAKHLHIPETTLRRWRQRLSSPCGEDSAREVTRAGKTYVLATANIGKRGARTKKSRRNLRVELGAMKGNACSAVRPLLNVIDHWVRGWSTADKFLAALQGAVQGKHDSGERGSTIPPDPAPVGPEKTGQWNTR
jgi:hypothetical protein